MSALEVSTILDILPVQSLYQKVREARNRAKDMGRPVPELTEKTFTRAIAVMESQVADGSFLENTDLKFQNWRSVPKMLRRAEVKVWLKIDEVKSGITRLAWSKLQGESTPDDTYSALVRRYTEITGETELAAEIAIDTILKLLIVSVFEEFSSGEAALLEILLSVKEDISRLVELTNRRSATSESRPSDFKQRLDACRKVSFLGEHAWPALLRLATEVIHQPRGFVDDELILETFQVLKRNAIILGESEEYAKVAGFRLDLRQALKEDLLIKVLEEYQDENLGKAKDLLRGRVISADHRSIMLLVLSKEEDPMIAVEWAEQCIIASGAEAFTSAGWSTLTVHILRNGLWGQDYLLRAVEDRSIDSPHFSILKAMILTALTIPLNDRQALVDTHFAPKIAFSTEGPMERNYRRKAVAAFEAAEEGFLNCQRLIGVDLDEPLRVCRYWRTWLLLTSEDRLQVAKGIQRTQEALNDDLDLDHVLLACVYDVEFDSDGLWHAVNAKRKFFNLSPRDEVTRCFLAETIMDSEGYLEFLARSWVELVEKGVPEEVLISARIHTLLDLERVSEARQVFAEQGEGLDGVQKARVESSLAHAEGGDGFEILSQTYSGEVAIPDLHNLAISALKTGRFDRAMAYSAELFDKQRSKSSLALYIRCLVQVEASPYRIYSILSESQDLVSRSEELKVRMAQVLLALGKFRESQEQIGQVEREAVSNEDILNLRIDLAVCTGRWSDFSAIVEGAWPQRNKFHPRTILRLAQLAAEVDSQRARAVELVRLAAEKGKQDPGILTACVSLAFSLGFEGFEVGEWMDQAVQQSGAEGPMRKLSIKTVVEELMPNRRAELRTADEHWRAGTWPLELILRTIGQSLTWLYLSIPFQNLGQTDMRKLVWLPAISGARTLQEIPKGATLGVSLTSLLLLSSMESLHLLPAKVKGLVVPMGIMQELLNERRRTRFHQPRLVEKASEFLALLDDGQIHQLEHTSSNGALKSEVEEELADLLLMAEEKNGVVVCARPVRKVGDLTGKQASLGHYERFLVTPSQLVDACFKQGVVDQASYEKARDFFRRKYDDYDSGMHDLDDIRNKLVLFDHLGVSELEASSCWRNLVTGLETCSVHPHLVREREAILRDSGDGAKLNEHLTRIRDFLYDGWDSGFVQFMPRWGSDFDEKFLDMIPSSAQFFDDISGIDGVLVDDRFFNKNSQLTDRLNNRRKIFSLIDLIGEEENGPALHRLHECRRRGLAFVPLTERELWERLSTAVDLSESELIETVELATIRRYYGGLLLSGLLSLPREAEFLRQSASAGIACIQRVWMSEDLPVNLAETVSNWLLDAILEWAGGFLTYSRDYSEYFLPRVLSDLLRLCFMVDSNRLIGLHQWLEGERFRGAILAHSKEIDTALQNLLATVRRVKENGNE